MQDAGRDSKPGVGAKDLTPRESEAVAMAAVALRKALHRFAVEPAEEAREE